MAENGVGGGPRDAVVMEAILREMGVEDFEPNLIHQMLEFSYSQWNNKLTILIIPQASLLQGLGGSGKYR